MRNLGEKQQIHCWARARTNWVCSSFGKRTRWQFVVARPPLLSPLPPNSDTILVPVAIVVLARATSAIGGGGGSKFRANWRTFLACVRARALTKQEKMRDRISPLQVSALFLPPSRPAALASIPTTVARSRSKFRSDEMEERNWWGGDVDGHSCQSELGESDDRN